MRSAIAFLLALLMFAAPARAQTADAEAFVTRNITTAFAILKDAALTPDARARKMEEHLLALTDLPRVAVFTLGSAKADPAQRDAFIAAFRDYALASWRSQFLLFGSGSMAVTGSRQNAPGDVVVRTLLRDTAGSVAVPVDFRIRTDGASPVIIDIGLAGIWLAVTQRDDFAAFLARNKGDVDALTASLAARAQALR